MGNTILAKRGNHIVAKGDNSGWPKGSKLSGFSTGHKASPSNEQFLTDKEVSAWLKVSRRTLQDYRSNGMIAYYQLGGKILYKESDIEKMVMSGYRNAYRLET